MKLRPNSKISKETQPTAEYSSRIASLFYMIEDLPISNVLLLSISSISVVFSGLTESSSFSEQASRQNFTVRGITKLPQYSRIIQRWTITNDSYEILLTDLVNAFLYLDPPYEIDSNLYGKKGDMHEGFDHDKFAEKCDNRVAKMLISYNSSQLIKDRFNSWSASEYSHTYTMRSVGDYMSKQKQRKELLLFNYNKEPKIQFSFGGCYNYDKLNSSGLT